MKRLLSIAVAGLLILASTPLANSAPIPKSGAGTDTYYDGFNGKFALDWKVVRGDADHVSLKKVPGALVITTQRGSIHGKEKDDKLSDGLRAKNIHLIDIRFAKDKDWVS